VNKFDTQPIELPIVGLPTERADAARNRQLILAAAERLFACKGVACTSMDAIAAEAGVGKGTLFRRFGDRASLVFALLDSVERVFQDGFISGPPPLGPGAPPQERLIAFGQSLLEYIDANGELLLGAQSAGVPIARFDAGPYGAYRAHLTMLIREAAPDLDAEYTAEALLTPLRAEAVLYQLRVRQMPLERLTAGWSELARRVVSG
jgi:AcrR family transcriptional regulator